MTLLLFLLQIAKFTRRWTSFQSAAGGKRRSRCWRELLLLLLLLVVVFAAAHDNDDDNVVEKSVPNVIPQLLYTVARKSSGKVFFFVVCAMCTNAKRSDVRNNA